MGAVLQCVVCGSERLAKAGYDQPRQQRYRCPRCGRRQTARSASAFCGYRFPDAIIALAVRWYLRYRLSYEDVAELLAERGVHMDGSTIFDWVQPFTPLYQEFARSHRHRPRGKWSIDETYVKIAGIPCYVFRAIDDLGQVVDVYVSMTRDTAAAVLFLTRAVEGTGVRPHTATSDKAAIYPPALQLVLPEALHRVGKADQQAIERDHQHLKGRYRSMRGFKRVHTAQTVCAGHGFVRNLREGYYRQGVIMADPRIPQTPRLMRAWDELTERLQAA
jgi:transposase-like protein